MNISNVSSYKNHLDFKLREQTQAQGQRYREINKQKESNTSNEQYFSGRRYNIGKDTVSISQEGIAALTNLRDQNSSESSKVSSNNNSATIEELQQRVIRQREEKLDVIAKEQGIPVNELKSQIKEADPKELKVISDKLNLGIEQLMQFRGNNLWL